MLRLTEMSPPGTRRTLKTSAARSGWRKGIDMTARRSCVAVLCAKKSVGKWVCLSLFRFLIRLDRGPFKILKTKVWVRIRNTNNSTVLEF